MSGRAALEVRPIEHRDLASVARIHVAAFAKSALTRLGEEAVRRYYDWLLVGPHQTTALGCFADGELAAYVFGGRFTGAMTGFLHRNRAYLAVRVATRPWLVNTPLFRDRIAAAFRLLWSRKTHMTPKPATSAPAFGILSIAAHPRWEGVGAAKLLMKRATERARELGFATMELTVAEDNTRAIAFYERDGWHKVVKDGAWSEGVMRKVVDS